MTKIDEMIKDLEEIQSAYEITEDEEVKKSYYKQLELIEKEIKKIKR